MKEDSTMVCKDNRIIAREWRVPAGGLISADPPKYGA